MKKILNRPLLLIYLLVIAIPAVMSGVDILSGSMPFWFDPARDYLLALGNLNKVSFIGQPTGIPGLFYGPYWIWLLSIALLISKDPRIVQILVLAIPYFTIFPLTLYKLSKIFDLKIIITLWTLFILAYLRYTIFPWNPHLAPLFVLIIFYFLITRQKENLKRYFTNTFLAGLITGIVGNFHLSFTIGLIIGVLLFFVLEFLSQINISSFKKLLFNSFYYFLGFVIAFVPFLLFEFRHGFNQIKTVVETLGNPNAVVGIKGLTDQAIIQRFFNVLAETLHIPNTLVPIVLVAVVLYIGVLILRRKLSLTESERNLFLLSFSVLTSVMFVFLTSKNPVWEYHFIAVEVIFLLLTGLVMKKLLIARVVIIIWAAFIFLSSAYFFIFTPRPDVFSYDTLAKKEYIVETVNKDANGKNYSVFTYNPGIYSYDYSYLFNWMVGKNVPYDPSNIKPGADLIYLVIQKTDPGIFQDYINSHTPADKYKTSRKWNIADGTVIIRREAIEH